MVTAGGRDSRKKAQEAQKEPDQRELLILPTATSRNSFAHFVPFRGYPAFAVRTFGIEPHLP